MLSLTSFALFPQPARASSPIPMQIGINVGGISDYNREVQFNDAMKISRPFQAYSWAHPANSQTTVVLDNGGYFPGGNFTMSFSGSGDINSWADASQQITQSPTTFSWTPTPNTDSGFIFSIQQSSTSNPISNIQFFMPGCTGQSSAFYSYYEQRLAPFSCLRFMDMGNTNSNTIVNWSSRPLPTDQTYAGPYGAPLEIMIELCNETNHDGWFCIPTYANDNYITNMAALIASKLNPNLHCYMEYSNEVWNGSFQQNAYSIQQGVAAGLSTNQYQAGWDWYAQHTVHCAQIFKAAMGTRCIAVMGTQFVNSYISQQELAYNNAYKNVDVLAVAPYYGYTINNLTQAQIDAMTPAQVNAFCLNEINTADLQSMQSQADTAQQYGVQLVAYEGGAGLAAPPQYYSDTTMVNLFANANRDASIVPCYQALFKNWQKVGGTLFNQYDFIGAYSQYGDWGILEYYNEPTSYKYQAVVAAANAYNPAPISPPTSPPPTSPPPSHGGTPPPSHGGTPPPSHGGTPPPSHHTTPPSPPPSHNHSLPPKSHNDLGEPHLTKIGDKLYEVYKSRSGQIHMIPIKLHVGTHSGNDPHFVKIDGKWYEIAH
jgi:hypothetical protein